MNEEAKKDGVWEIERASGPLGSLIGSFMPVPQVSGCGEIRGPDGVLKATFIIGDAPEVEAKQEVIS